MKTKFFSNVILLIAIVSVISCQTQPPDENPKIKERFKKIEDSAASKSDLADLSLELDGIKDDLTTVKTAMGQGTNLDQTVADLDKTVKSLIETVNAIEAKMSKVEKGGASARVESKSSAAVSETAAAPSGGEQQSSAPKGYYYTAKSGDTFAEIARANNTSVSDILKINMLPDNAKVVAGQRLYIIPNK